MYISRVLTTNEISALAGLPEKSHHPTMWYSGRGDTRYGRETWVQDLSPPLTNFSKLLESVFSLLYIHTYRAIGKFKLKKKKIHTYTGNLANTEKAFSYCYDPCFTNLSSKAQIYTYVHTHTYTYIQGPILSFQQSSMEQQGLCLYSPVPWGGTSHHSFVNTSETYWTLSAGVRWSSEYLTPVKVATA